MISRRDFLKTSSLLALGPVVPGFLAQTARATQPQADGRVLVVIQLDGGNDGINTVVPYRDEGYARNRQRLALPTNRLIRVNEQLGLHPSLTGFGALLDAGHLAIVPGVGYPNPSRSHFRSMATWHSARLDPEDHNGIGWLGRALDNQTPPAGAPAALLVGANQPPAAIRGRRVGADAIERAEDFALTAGADARSVIGPAGSADDLTAFVRRSMLDSYAASDQLRRLTTSANDAAYPSSGLGNRLRLVAQLLKAGFGTRVFYTLQSGYDTHSEQLFPHSSLLFALSGAVKAFFDDLTAARLADRVVVLAFSEFGRRVRENASQGTDHGTAGPVFIVGPAVRAGLHGDMPSLLDLEDGDLKMTIDFRRVYASILNDWLRLPSQAALPGAYEPLALFRNG